MYLNYENLIESLVEKFNRENKDRNLTVTRVQILTDIPAPNQKASTTYVEITAHDNDAPATQLSHLTFRFEVPWTIGSGRCNLDYGAMYMKISNNFS